MRRWNLRGKILAIVASTAVVASLGLTTRISFANLVHNIDVSTTTGLVNAINTANSDTANSYVIRLAAGTYRPTAALHPLITTDLNIEGSSGSASSYVINGSNNGGYSVIVNEGNDTTISNLTITGGHVTYVNGYEGGGIDNESPGLTLNNVVVTGNDADYYGGGIFNDSGFTMNGGAITGNHVPEVGGDGGGLYGDADQTLNDVTVAGNWAGASRLPQTLRCDCLAQGGGIYNNSGTTHINGGSISANVAGYAGGGITSGNSYTYLHINDPGSKTTNFAGNKAQYYGGAISDYYAEDSVLNNLNLTGNTTGYRCWNGYSGGIDNDNADETLTNSKLKGNIAHPRAPTCGPAGHSSAHRPLISAPGVCEFAEHSSCGGGLSVYQGTETVSNTTFTNNQATDGGNVYTYDSDVTVSNSLLFLGIADRGGGLYEDFDSDMTFSNVNVLANFAKTAGGGIWLGCSADYQADSTTKVIGNVPQNIYSGC